MDIKDDTNETFYRYMPCTCTCHPEKDIRNSRIIVLNKIPPEHFFLQQKFYSCNRNFILETSIFLEQEFFSTNLKKILLQVFFFFLKLVENILASRKKILYQRIKVLLQE